MKKFLRKEYKYKRKFINACILRIRFGGRDEKTVRGFKTYIFKAMKGIVDKNIYNYLNLLNGSPCRELPEYNEVLSECWIIFDKCLSKYKVTKYNNFYFYFNKALSRNFFRCYNKEINFPSSELTDEMSVVHPALSHNPHLDTEEVLFDNLRFSKLEKRICRSRMKGERISEFLKKNKRVTAKQYNAALLNIKRIILEAKSENKY